MTNTLVKTNAQARSLMFSMRRKQVATGTTTCTGGQKRGPSLQKIPGLSRYSGICLCISMIFAMYAKPIYSQPYFEGWSPSHEYDASGFNPSIATNGVTAVEVHNGSGTAGPLWYRVGQLNGSTLTWGNSYQYDVGFNPSVAISGTTVVEVHNGSGAAGPMWYRVGTIGGWGITWGDSNEYDWGWNPKIAVLAGYILEVHNGSGSSGPMWYHFGYFSGATTITMGGSYQYDTGFNPAVAASGYIAVEVHDGGATAGPLWYHTGSIGVLQ
jgi:hypothetical protein